MVKAQYHRSICVLTVNHGSYFAGLVPCLAQGYAQDTSTRHPKVLYARYHKIFRKKCFFLAFLNFIPTQAFPQFTYHHFLKDMDCRNDQSNFSDHHTNRIQHKFKVWDLQEDMTSNHHSCMPHVSSRIMYHSLANKSHLFHFAKEGKKWFVEISLKGGESWPWKVEFCSRWILPFSGLKIGIWLKKFIALSQPVSRWITWTQNKISIFPMTHLA